MNTIVFALTILLSSTLCASSQVQWTTTLEDTTLLSNWIDCVDSLNCLIVASPYLSLDISVLKTTDGGHTFQQFAVHTGDVYLGRPRRIYYPSKDTAYFLAEHGQFFRSLDGGQTWEVVSIIRDLPWRYFTPLSFRTSQQGIVAVRGVPKWADSTADSVDMVYRTEDGGEAWSREVLPSPPGDSVMHPSAVHEFESGRISVVWYGVESAQHYFSTKPAGSNTWEHVGFPDSKGVFFDFVCISESTYYLTYMVRKPREPNGEYVYSLIHKSTDYGQTWETVFDGLDRDSTAIADLAFQDSATGLATSDVGVFRTTNGGDTWTKETFTPPLVAPSYVVASYPRGSDGIILTYDFNDTHVYLPDGTGGVVDRLQQTDALTNVRLSPTAGTSNGYLLTFESSDGAGVSLRLYDVLGSAIFSAEYETSVGSNTIVLDLPSRTTCLGFLRILTHNSDVTLPIILD